MATLQIALFEFEPVAAAAATFRIIRHCKRRGCGHTWARDYDLKTRTRLDSSASCGVARSADYAENQCPKCQTFRIDSHAVQGNLNKNQLCDSRCLCAVGPICSCSCGGKNHGKSWLI